MATHHSGFSKKTKIVAVGSLTAFFVIGGTHFFYHYQKPSGSSPSKSSTVNELTKAGTANVALANANSVSSSSSPFANWKNYKASKFQVKYPNTWYTAQERGEQIDGDNQTTLSNEKIKFYSQMSKNGMYVNISRFTSTNLPDFFKAVLNSPDGKMNQTGSYNPYEIYTRVGQVTIDGIQAVKYTNDYSHDPQGGADYELGYVITKGSEYYVISFTLNHTMLSSYNSQMQELVNSFIFN
jgi:hypothetical protein